MTIVENAAALRGNHGTIIEVAGTDLVFRSIELDTDTPTGGKIAREAGFTGDQHPYVLQWRQDGDLEDIRPLEEADLTKGLRFIVAEASGTNRITIDDDQHDWPAEVISGAVIRKLGKIPTDKLIYQEREDEPDREISDEDLIPIKRDGIEEFKSRKAVWEISVQGVVVKSNVPKISAADALSKAGFEEPTAWIIVLKIDGKPKLQIDPNYVIDLRTPGIEKIRLTPKEVNNGEVCSAPRRQFDLLPVDELYLDNLGLTWETVIEGESRWLMIADFPIVTGYQVGKITLALMVPPIYPQAEIDMFHVHPHLKKAAGGPPIPNLMEQVIGGVTFQTWSRHRGETSRWSPRRDNVVTHLALVESAVAKEVGQ